MHKVIIDSNSGGQRADKFLKKYLPLAPQNFIYKMFRKKDVKLNGKRIDEKTMIQTGDVLELFLYDDKVQSFQQEVQIEYLKPQFEVVYEDDNILIVNKPVGLILHEDEKEKKNTLANQVLAYLYEKGAYNPNNNQGFVPGPVHRLDRNTSGLVIFGKTFNSLKDLNEMIRKRHCISKQYKTILVGQIKKSEHLIGYMKKDEKTNHCFMVSKDTLGALTMETIIDVEKSNKNYTLAKVTLVTGRTHQIRLHCASINHPVIGDRKYGDFKVNKLMKDKYHLAAQLLHAYGLTFVKSFGSLAYLEGKTFTCNVPQLFSQIQNDLFNVEKRN